LLSDIDSGGGGLQRFARDPMAGIKYDAV